MRPYFEFFRSAQFIFVIILAWTTATGAHADSLLTSAAAAQSQTKAVTFKSKDTQTSLLELYTSQGCYSCPPAEAWLGQFTDYPGLWQHVVPVALHVDYWDYLGWKDRYGDVRNQRRHYSYKFQGHTKAIYTPEMILNGRDYTIWRRGKWPDFATDNKVGSLELKLDQRGIKLVFNRQGGRQDPLRAHVALLGFGIVDSIGAGENAGKTLTHEFVALAQNEKMAHPVGQLYGWQFPPLESDHTRQRSAVIAWVDAAEDNRPIQAVGGWLD